ncbi:22271_t:CDS:1, partial [Gigaspora margarita]
PSQLSEVHESEVINSEPEKWPITFEARPNQELIINSVLKHFPYLKFRNSFRGIDNYNFVSAQPWDSSCPICDGIHGNYGLHGS